MKTRILFHYALVLAGLLFSVQAWGTHITGGELFYEPVPGIANRYHVTARLYRNLESSNADFIQSITLSCGLNGCSSTTPGSFTAPLTLMQRQFIDPVQCGATTYQIGTLEGEVTLPPGRWTLSITESNRASGIYNITDSGTYTIYLEAFLDNTTGLANSSPRFTSYKLPYLSGNQRHEYSASAFDIDGDSLVYQIVPPLTGGNNTLPCATSISGFQTPPHFQINSATGALTTTSAALIVGDIALPVRVDEYRRLNNVWTKIGSITRDQLYRGYASSNLNPTFTGLSVGNSAATQPLEQPISVNPGRTVVVNLTGTDPDAGQTLRFISDAPSVVPGASFQALNATQARLTWNVPASLPLGRYRLAVAVADNGCPVNASEGRTLTFLVTNRVLAVAATRPAHLSANPNPFHEQVSFKLATPQAVVVLDALGRVVDHLTSRADGTVTWQPAATVVPGLYLGRTADGLQVVRLVRE